MHEAEFSIQTPTENVMTLDQAVLLYHGRNGGALATVHEVMTMGGASVIGAGRAMTAQAARELAAALLQKVAYGGFLPETVLYLRGDLILWWVPPASRHVVFRVESGHAAALGGVERGETVPLPGLIFAASNQTWRVWAVKGSRRPTPQTPLYQAPFFNVNAQGAICQGNVPVPEGTTVEKIGAWNDAFFRSYFTHPNVTGKLLRYRGGAYAFWRDMLDQRFTRFPERVLADAKTTLGGLLGQREDK